MIMKNGQEQMLEKAFSQMGEIFSSNEFCKALRRHGYSERLIHNGKDHLYFLHKNCQQHGTKKAWVKNGSRLQLDQPDETLKAIKLLKNKGYRVLKPKQDWEDL